MPFKVIYPSYGLKVKSQKERKVRKLCMVLLMPSRAKYSELTILPLNYQEFI